MRGFAATPLDSGQNHSGMRGLETLDSALHFVPAEKGAKRLTPLDSGQNHSGMTEI